MHRAGAFQCNFQYLYFTLYLFLSPFVLAVRPQKRMTVSVSTSQTSQLVRMLFSKTDGNWHQNSGNDRAGGCYLLLPSWERRHLVSP